MGRRERQRRLGRRCSLQPGNASPSRATTTPPWRAFSTGQGWPEAACTTTSRGQSRDLRRRVRTCRRRIPPTTRLQFGAALGRRPAQGRCQRLPRALHRRILRPHRSGRSPKVIPGGARARFLLRNCSGNSWPRPSPAGNCAPSTSTPRPWRSTAPSHARVEYVIGSSDPRSAARVAERTVAALIDGLREVRSGADADAD